MISITLNGEPREIVPSSVMALLASLDITPNKIAVERNREIVPKSLFADTDLCDGDQVEIVQFVGGG